MDLLYRATAVLLLSSLLGILLKKNAPELSLLLSLAAVLFVFLSAMSAAEQFREFVRTIQSYLSGMDMLMLPVFKCLAIAVTSRVGAELCRDANQAAAASSLELMGTVCALGVAMPLILSLVKTLGGLL